ELLAAGIAGRTADVYSTGGVLWEALTGRVAFDGGDGDGDAPEQLLLMDLESPSRLAPGGPTGLGAVVRRAVSPVPRALFATARQMATAVWRALPGCAGEGAAWRQALGAAELAARAAVVARVEQAEAQAGTGEPPPAKPPEGEVDVWRAFAPPARRR